MTDPMIPLPILVVIVAAIVAAIVAIATWAIRTVRRAAIVVAADDIKADALEAFKSTVEAQDGCIEALNRQVLAIAEEAERTKKSLTDQLTKALARILDLERIISEWKNVDDILARQRATRHEAREVRLEARQMAQEARAVDKA